MPSHASDRPCRWLSTCKCAVGGIALAVALAFTSHLVAGQTGIAQGESGGNVTRDDRLFDQVPLNSRERTACSPDNPGPRWRGILINAPTRASRQTGSIPICGLYTLELTAIAANLPLTLVAVDVQRGETFKGAVVNKDPSPEVPPPGKKPFDPTRFQGLATSS